MALIKLLQLHNLCALKVFKTQPGAAYVQQDIDQAINTTVIHDMTGMSIVITGNATNIVDSNRLLTGLNIEMDSVVVDAADTSSNRSGYRY